MHHVYSKTQLGVDHVSDNEISDDCADHWAGVLPSLLHVGGKERQGRLQSRAVVVYLLGHDGIPSFSTIVSNSKNITELEPFLLDRMRKETGQVLHIY